MQKDHNFVSEIQQEFSATDKFFVGNNNYFDNYNNLLVQLEREKNLKSIIKSISETLELDKIIKIAVNQIGRILKVDRCIVSFLDEPRQKFLFEKEYLSSPEIDSILNIEADYDVWANWTDILKNDQNPIVVNSVKCSFITEDQRKLFDRYKIKSTINVPLIYKEKYFGAIIVQQVNYQRNWTEDEVEFLQNIGINLAVAINQAKIHHELLKQAKKEKMLKEITEKIRNSLNLKEVIDCICLEIAKMFDIHRVTIIDFEESVSKDCDIVADYTSCDDLQKIYGTPSYQAVKAFWKDIICNGKIFAVNNINNSELPDSIKQIYDAVSVKSVIGLPIYSDDINLCGIFLTDYKKYRVWTEDDIELLKLISDSISIALKQARLYEKALISVKIKNEFISTISHEIRTPLNAILGFSQLLLSVDHPAEKQQRYLNNIKVSGEHLLQIINDLLDLSKAESGNMEMNFEAVKSEKAILETVDSLKSLYIQKNITLKHKLASVTIQADERKIRQIMYNLLSNAIKFTPDNGSIDIESVINAKELVISVKDNGIGIEEKDFGKMFEKFKQADSSYSRTFEGTGLGLALTKKLVQLHGGMINFSSERNVGSKFWFSIPMTVN